MVMQKETPTMQSLKLTHLLVDKKSLRTKNDVAYIGKRKCAWQIRTTIPIMA